MSGLPLTACLLYTSHFSSPIKESRGIESRRAVLNTGELIQTLFPVKDGVELEVSFQNTSASPVHLDRFVLFRTDDLKLGTLPSTEWFFFRQGRMKNELPAVCRLGDLGAVSYTHLPISRIVSLAILGIST